MHREYVNTTSCGQTRTIDLDKEQGPYTSLSMIFLWISMINRVSKRRKGEQLNFNGSNCECQGWRWECWELCKLIRVCQHTFTYLLWWRMSVPPWLWNQISLNRPSISWRGRCGLKLWHLARSFSAAKSDLYQSQWKLTHISLPFLTCQMRTWSYVMASMRPTLPSQSTRFLFI